MEKNVLSKLSLYIKLIQERKIAERLQKYKTTYEILLNKDVINRSKRDRFLAKGLEHGFIDRSLITDNREKDKIKDNKNQDKIETISKRYYRHYSPVKNDFQHSTGKDYKEKDKSIDKG